jgi:hypothetical protein
MMGSVLLRHWLVAAVLFACSSEPTPDAPNTTAVSGEFLLAFHGCTPGDGVDCGMPTAHETYFAQGTGASWAAVPGWEAYAGSGPGSSASVPDVIRRGNTVYFYNPNVLHRYDITTGELSDAIPVVLSGTDSSGFVDPSPMLLDGRIVLFYLPGIAGQNPAGCSNGEPSCERAIHSATEVDGSDGAAFVQDPGSRVSETLVPPASFSDPDVFADASGYVLYVSQGADVLAYRASEPRGSYVSVPELGGEPLSRNNGGVPAGHHDAATGEYWTYVTSTVNGVSVIRRAVHLSLGTRLDASEFHTVLDATKAGLAAGTHIESPGIARNVP